MTNKRNLEGSTNDSKLFQIYKENVDDRTRANGKKINSIS